MYSRLAFSYKICLMYLRVTSPLTRRNMLAASAVMSGSSPRKRRKFAYSSKKTNHLTRFR